MLHELPDNLNQEVVSLLIKAGISAKDNSGNTALHYSDNSEFAELMSDVDLNITNNKGEYTAAQIILSKEKRNN